MNRLAACLAAIFVAVLSFGCDSAADNGAAAPDSPPSLITGFYIVLEAPPGSKVSYRVTEYDEYGSAVADRAPVVVEASTGGAQVIDLCEKGMDPGGIAVAAKLTSGSGTLKLELWRDSNLESSAETRRQNYQICVTGGTCRLSF